MTRQERDSLMKYSGIIQGIGMMLDIVELEPDEEADADTDFTRFVSGHLKDISNDLEAIAKGYD